MGPGNLSRAELEALNALARLPLELERIRKAVERLADAAERAERRRELADDDGPFYTPGDRAVDDVPLPPG